GGGARRGRGRGLKRGRKGPRTTRANGQLAPTGGARPLVGSKTQNPGPTGQHQESSRGSRDRRPQPGLGRIPSQTLSRPSRRPATGPTRGPTASKTTPDFPSSISSVPAWSPRSRASAIIAGEIASTPLGSP